MLRFGKLAPDFTLPATQGGPITLSQFQRTSDVVLIFYCYDWGGI